VVVEKKREGCYSKWQQEVGYVSQEGGMFWIMLALRQRLEACACLPACATASIEVPSVSCGARFFCNAEAEKP
jgi:hypothetical protein